MLPKGAACSYIIHPCSLHDDLYGTIKPFDLAKGSFLSRLTITQCYAGLVCPWGCCEENLFDTPFFCSPMEDSDLGKKGGGNTTVSSSIDSREIPRSPFVLFLQYAPTRSTVFSD
jgi:hypothetical protein